MAERAAENEPDPGADTEMFRAFVEREETYEPKSASLAPIFVAVGAVVVALLAFLIIIAVG
ncbi:MAG TPA: hypothetical protein VMZ00_11835 [Sporichthya sp.]|nr:hypothetical protein [Sporichthya sp.]